MPAAAWWLVRKGIARIFRASVPNADSARARRRAVRANPDSRWHSQWRFRQSWDAPGISPRRVQQRQTRLLWLPFDAESLRSNASLPEGAFLEFGAPPHRRAHRPAL